MMKHVKVFLMFSMFLIGVLSFSKSPEKLKFAFVTDIHLNKKNSGDSYNGLLQALQRVEKEKVDFILIGGDVVDISGMKKALEKKDADSLYILYKETFDKMKIPYYPTLGNHDRYFDKENGFDKGDELFKGYFKNSYYTFVKKGVCFFVLNSVQITDKGDLSVDDEQLRWIKSELEKIDVNTPIIISTHVPIYSMYYPVVENKYIFRDVISNYKELLDTFKGHNLKLVLQGHQHLYEEIKLQGVQYITGGAVSAGWWRGAFHGTEEGFLKVSINAQNDITWSYIDYGWTVR